MKHPVHRAQRVAPLRTMLDYAAMVGIALAFLWQVRIQWTLAGVENVLSLDAVLVVITAAALAVVAPALVSSLIPNTPAGQLLQRINRYTLGFVAVVAFSVFLLYYTVQLMLSFWASRPAVAESGFTTMQATVMAILMIGVPALAWTQIDPARLVAELKQAHLVKRYELMMQADLAILQTTMLRANTLAARGMANLPPDEQAELAAIFRGITRGIDQSLAELERTLHMASGAVIPLPRIGDNPDADAAQNDLRELLEVLHSHAAELVAPLEPDAAAADSYDAHHASYSVTQYDTVSHVIPDHTYDTAVATLNAPARQGYLTASTTLAGVVWTYHDIMRVLVCQSAKAGNLIRAWTTAGLAVAVAENSGRYIFVQKGN